MINKGGEEKSTSVYMEIILEESGKYFCFCISKKLYICVCELYIFIQYLYPPIYVNLRWIVFMNENRENGERGAKVLIYLLWSVRTL